MTDSIARSHILPPNKRLFEFGLIAVIVLFLAISSLMLDLFGWHYGSPGGTALEKVHPATLLLFVLLFLSAAMRGNPLSSLIEAAREHPVVSIYVVAVLVLILQTIVILDQPFTVYIDTFLAPAAVFLLLHHMTNARGQRLAKVMHGLFFLNAVIGILEFRYGFRVTPFVIEGVSYTQEWRSSALFGHPLSNALLTGCYVMSLALGGGRDLPLVVRFGAFTVAAMSMAVFGGRAATAVLIAGLAALAFKKLFSILSGSTFDKRILVSVLLAAPAALIALAFISDTGFFDQFLSRILDDEGSAGTRVAMFEIFRHFTWYDLFVGASSRHLETYTTIYGLELGIESFWLSMVLDHGLVVAVPFFVVLILFCREVARAANWGPAVWVLVSFFAVASTSVSLSVKTPDLAILVAMILVLLRKPQLISYPEASSLQPQTTKR